MAQAKSGQRQSSIRGSTPVNKTVISEAQRKDAHAKLMAHLHIMKEKISARTPPEVLEIDSPNSEPECSVSGPTNDDDDVQLIFCRDTGFQNQEDSTSILNRHTLEHLGDTSHRCHLPEFSEVDDLPIDAHRTSQAEDSANRTNSIVLSNTEQNVLNLSLQHLKTNEQDRLQRMWQTQSTSSSDASSDESSRNDSSLGNDKLVLWNSRNEAKIDTDSGVVYKSDPPSTSSDEDDDDVNDPTFVPVSKFKKEKRNNLPITRRSTHGMKKKPRSVTALNLDDNIFGRKCTQEASKTFRQKSQQRKNSKSHGMNLTHPMKRSFSSASSHRAMDRSPFSEDTVQKPNNSDTCLKPGCSKNESEAKNEHSDILQEKYSSESDLFSSSKSEMQPRENMPPQTTDSNCHASYTSISTKSPPRVETKDSWGSFSIIATPNDLQPNTSDCMYSSGEGSSCKEEGTLPWAHSVQNASYNNSCTTSGNSNENLLFSSHNNSFEANSHATFHDGSSSPSDESIYKYNIIRKRLLWNKKPKFHKNDTLIPATKEATINQRPTIGYNHETFEEHSTGDEFTPIDWCFFQPQPFIEHSSDDEPVTSNWSLQALHIQQNLKNANWIQERDESEWMPRISADDHYNYQRNEISSLQSTKYHPNVAANSPNILRTSISPQHLSFQEDSTEVVDLNMQQESDFTSDLDHAANFHGKITAEWEELIPKNAEEAERQFEEVIMESMWVDEGRLFTFEEFMDFFQNEVEGNIGGILDFEGGSLVRGGNIGKSRRTQYGRIQFTATNILLREMNLTSKDRFIDIGSGIGTAVIQAACTFGCDSLGIEIDQGRSLIANEIKEAVNSAYDLRKRKHAEVIKKGFIRLEEGDIQDLKFRHDIINQTVALANNAHNVFGADKEGDPSLDERVGAIFALMKPGSRLATLQQLFCLNASEEECRQRQISRTNIRPFYTFFKKRIFVLPESSVSWSDTKTVEVYIYTRIETPFEKDETGKTAAFVCEACGEVNPAVDEKDLILIDTCFNSACGTRSQRQIRATRKPDRLTL